MSSATSDEFLSGQGVAVELHDIETELTRLWGPAAAQAGGPDLENPHVTRIALANLVVFGDLAEAHRLEPRIDTVAARHPSRTIVLRRTEETERAVSAEVSAVCHLPAPGLPQVCSERILLRAGPNAMDLLPGAVRPLLEAELPFVLWWTLDPRQDEDLFRDLANECSRLILDLPDPQADPAAIKLGLDLSVCEFTKDAAWFGLTRWRELVAQFFDTPAHIETLDRIDSVQIKVVAASAERVPRLAVWLASWLAGQLGWTPAGQPERAPGCLCAEYQGPGGTIAVAIRTEVDPAVEFAQILSITLTTRPCGPCGAESFRLIRRVREYPELHVEIDSTEYCTLPRTVLAPEIDAPSRVSAALESSRLDPPYEKALPHVLWLLGA